MSKKRVYKREFTKGEKYRPRVTVEKVKKGKPTVLMISGRRYVWEPRDMYKG